MSVNSSHKQNKTFSWTKEHSITKKIKRNIHSNHYNKSIPLDKTRHISTTFQFEMNINAEELSERKTNVIGNMIFHCLHDLLCPYTENGEL